MSHQKLRKLVVLMARSKSLIRKRLHTLYSIEADFGGGLVSRD